VTVPPTDVVGGTVMWGVESESPVLGESFHDRAEPVEQEGEEGHHARAGEEGHHAPRR